MARTGPNHVRFGPMWLKNESKVQILSFNGISVSTCLDQLFVVVKLTAASVLLVELALADVSAVLKMPSPAVGTGVGGKGVRGGSSKALCFIVC